MPDGFTDNPNCNHISGTGDECYTCDVCGAVVHVDYERPCQEPIDRHLVRCNREQLAKLTETIAECRREIETLEAEVFG